MLILVMRAYGTSCERREKEALVRWLKPKINLMAGYTRFVYVPYMAEVVVHSLHTRLKKSGSEVLTMPRFIGKLLRFPGFHTDI
jgi:hypothetical protein